MRPVNRYNLFLTLPLLILILLLSGPTFAANENLVFDLRMHQPLELAPYNTQLLFYDGQLSALTVIKGKILYFKEIGSQWVELQRFGPQDINLTTFVVKDLDNDEVPEIIAGTEAPGLIYIYTLVNDQWSIVNYGKYVWSTINKIIAGNLSQVGSQELLIQNDEGYLFLLKPSVNSLDLIWKSPEIWKPISDAIVVDINDDSVDEILVVYKTGGIAILKIENNAIVSIWENYPWGKILGLTVGDWDNDQKPEGIFSTSQKILYVLGENEGEFQFEGQFSNFDRVIEKLSFINCQDQKVLITTDTAGHLKALQFDFEKGRWVERLNNQIGRISQIIQPHQERTLFWSSNRKVIELTSYKSLSLQVNFQDEQYQLWPNAISLNNQIYIPPKALANFFGYDFLYNEETKTYTISTNERTIEIYENELNLVSIDGLSKITLPFAPIIFSNELYFPIETLRSLLNLKLDFNFEEQTISIFN